MSGAVGGSKLETDWNMNNNGTTMADYERIRLVILGGAGVGKSCIIKRFLNNTYSDKYR